MRRAARITGRVLGPEGPLAGARVIAAHAERRVEAESDAQGRYVVPGVPAGPAQVFARLRGYYDPSGPPARSIRTVEALGTAAIELDIHMRPGGSVGGRVVAPGGEPIAGVEVRITHGEVFTTTTSADGRFLVRGVIPGADFGLYASMRGHVALDRVGRVPTGGQLTGLVLTMEPTPLVRGRVTAPSGALLSGAIVEVVAVPRDDSQPDRGERQSRRSAPEPVRSDGTYEAEIPWAGLGTFRVEVAAADFPVSSSPDVALVPGRTRYELDVVLEEGFALAGRVQQRGTENPVVGALIQMGHEIVAILRRPRFRLQRTRCWERGRRT